MNAVPTNRPFELGVAILAAGASSRMGRPKLLLAWRGTTVIDHLIGEWRALGASQVAVVCSQNLPNITAELNKLRFPLEARITNPHPARGMFSSIQCAAAWSGWEPRLTHWAIVLGDQPHLLRTTLEKVCRFAMEHPDDVCQPSWGASVGHPVLLPHAVFARLPQSAAPHFKAFLDSLHPPARLCPVEDPGLELDLDRPEDYERALKLPV